jgi:hypothetical protein
VGVVRGPAACGGAPGKVLKRASRPRPGGTGTGWSGRPPSGRASPGALLATPQHTLERTPPRTSTRAQAPRALRALPSGCELRAEMRSRAELTLGLQNPQQQARLWAAP